MLADFGGGRQQRQQYGLLKATEYVRHGVYIVYLYIVYRQEKSSMLLGNLSGPARYFSQEASMKSIWTGAASAAFLGLFVHTPVCAQMQDNRAKALACEGNNRGDRPRFCEMREQTIAAVGRLAVDPGKNGGVTIKGWLDSQVLVRSRVEAWGNTDSEAALLAARVRVDANTGQVSASGPDSQNNSGWSVSYEIFVPQTTDLKLSANNGGISISDVRGQIEFNARNGGVHLQRLAGDVSGSTVNGGIQIELAGNVWDGRQLEVSTRNGGVTLALPERYSAHLRTETINGGVRSDHPAIAVAARATRNIDANIGSGGPLIHLSTTNGGVTVKPL